MADTVEISLDLQCTLRRDARTRWVAGCPALDVYSQGRDESDARSSLEEAITLWVESCLERGTLDEALRELGFHRPDDEEADQAKPDAPGETAASGTETFSIHLKIPAYQTAALSRTA
jgi:predicted RNase H-like HicB family nuclease